MASKRTFRMFVEEELGEFPHFLVWAVLEWILIVSLFIDGFLAFVSSKFAKIFELKPPCVLCTRVDHALVGKKPNSYYNESICECHKKDISSLAYCHVHRKLSDIRNMCEGCLLSFATEKESDGDNNKSLVGMLQKDIDVFEDERRMFVKPPVKMTKDGNNNDGGLDTNRCSCCGEPLKMRPSKSFVRSASNIRLSSMAPAPSPRASIMPASWKGEDGKNLELPHIRYTELKFISDNEPELPEDDYGLNTDAKQIREDIKSATMPLLPDSEEINEESSRTPSFVRGNRFFGIPLTDSAAASPRWANRLPKKIALEKPDLLADVNDETPADGDSILHHLKRQVRMDRKMLIALYMELDEERSASAVAANNAMAMITRLQAEKAAVQMEALQYQRMMEEQAEYDQEAIQVLKDLLAKRDEDMKALESELETYREKHGEIKKVGSDECEADADDCYQELKSQSLSSFGEKSECGSPEDRDQNGDGESQSGRENEQMSSLDFETERSQLFGMLKNLENHIKSTEEEEEEEEEGDTEDKDIVPESKATLKREVSLIRERLRAIEADSGFLKHTAMTLQKGGEGTKLLAEIAQHLRKLRQAEKAGAAKTTDA